MIEVTFPLSLSLDLFHASVFILLTGVVVQLSKILGELKRRD